MDDKNIKDRLQDTAKTCLSAFEVWENNKKEAKSREGLQDAIHELRKVASRLEIELAISERDEMAQKPIPIPPHRASRNKRGAQPTAADMDIDGDQGGQKSGGKPRPSRGKPKKAAGGNSAE